MMLYAFDYSNLAESGTNVGIPLPFTVSLASGQTHSVTLTVCADGATPAVAPYKFQVIGTSGALSHQADVQVQVSATLDSTFHSSQHGFTGGMGLRVETSAASYNGLSASVTLPSLQPVTSPPSLTSSGTSIVLCGGNNDQGYGDAADIYTGSDSYSGLDFGFTLGHTGATSWQSVINNEDTKASPRDTLSGWVDDNGQKIKSTPHIYATGTVTLQIEGPGYNRIVNSETQLGNAVQDPTTGKIKPGYLVLRVKGGNLVGASGTTLDSVPHLIWFSDEAINGGEWQSNSMKVKRCNTIAQNPATMSGYYSTGTMVLGAAWQNVTLYSGYAPTGQPMTSANSTLTADPGLGQYMYWIDNPQYSNTTEIDLSTVPVLSH